MRRDPQPTRCASADPLGLGWGGTLADALLAAGGRPTDEAAACSFNIYQHTACTADPYKHEDNVTLAACCASCMADNQCAGFTLHSSEKGPGATGACLMSLGSGIRNPNHNRPGVTCGTRSPLAPTPPPGPGPSPSPTGDDVPLDFDCGARRLALGYADRLLGGRGQANVFEALQLGPKCHDPPPPPAAGGAAPSPIAGDGAAVSYFISPSGSDSAAGTSAAPWRTPARVLAALADRPAGARPSTTVNLLPGVYRLNETLAMTKAHSGASAAAPVTRTNASENLACAAELISEMFARAGRLARGAGRLRQCHHQRR